MYREDFYSSNFFEKEEIKDYIINLTETSKNYSFLIRLFAVKKETIILVFNCLFYGLISPEEINSLKIVTDQSVAELVEKAFDEAKIFSSEELFLSTNPIFSYVHFNDDGLKFHQLYLDYKNASFYQNDLYDFLLKIVYSSESKTFNSYTNYQAFASEFNEFILDKIKENFLVGIINDLFPSNGNLIFSNLEIDWIKVEFARVYNAVFSKFWNYFDDVNISDFIISSPLTRSICEEMSWYARDLFNFSYPYLNTPEVLDELCFKMEKNSETELFNNISSQEIKECIFGEDFLRSPSRCLNRYFIFLEALCRSNEFTLEETIEIRQSISILKGYIANFRALIIFINSKSITHLKVVPLIS